MSKKVTATKPPSLGDRATILDLLPIRDYKDGVFLLDDGSIMNLLWIQGRSYLHAHEEETARHIHQFALFFREYADDLKFVSLNFPTNTSKQQQYIMGKIEKTTDEKLEFFLENELGKLRWIQEKHIDIEHFLFIYAKDAVDYEKKETLILTKSSLSFQPMPKSKKLKIIRKLCNLHDDILD